ncbi:vacuolar protein sorting-associated protein 22 homolog 1-like [Humulus lupulus]|uniref:vacuolar protein sorting-associated protein 22 homolog 1-like n=1 Tax=Humulus lupulus TaxID=3486 RepID=UPI002B401112|nr:vacuolar protein sorting-associated protein 22 homolog 1-like [Humulus lupulus]
MYEIAGDLSFNKLEGELPNFVNIRKLRKLRTRVDIDGSCIGFRGPRGPIFGTFVYEEEVLGSGFEVISVGRKKLVRSVPTELNKDHNEILELAQAQGFVTIDEVERRLSWTTGRATDALDTLLDEGLAMIDDGHRDGKRQYWFPCVSPIASSLGVDS